VSDARLREADRRFRESRSVDDDAACLVERVRAGALAAEEAIEAVERWIDCPCAGHVDEARTQASWRTTRSRRSPRRRCVSAYGRRATRPAFRVRSHMATNPSHVPRATSHAILIADHGALRPAVTDAVVRWALS
jgi:hypothetical protein